MLVTTPHSARVLLAGAVDYAGLFPPAALSLEAAIAEFQACRASPDRWALGRFVAPVGLLDRFGEGALTAGLLPAAAGNPVEVSALLGEDVASGVTAVATFNATFERLGAAVRSVEARASTPSGVAAVAGASLRLGPEITCWVEVPLGAEVASLLDRLDPPRSAPKIRMGGIEPAAFPDPDHVIAFLQEVTRRRMPFKATAGLHHPIRGTYRYTYEVGSPSGPMYGYLNLMLATALLRAGGSAGEARALLLEQDATAIRLAEDEAEWHGHHFPLDALQGVRAGGMASFGSCSFREPLGDLSHLTGT